MYIHMFSSAAKFDAYFVLRAMLKLDRGKAAFDMVCCESKLIDIIVKALNLHFRDRFEGRDC